jgi:hypothetical protein
MPKDYALNPQQLEAYEQLKKIRESKTVALRPSSFLRQEVVGLDGSKEPFTLRYYQVQGTFHLMRMKRMVLGDDMGLGKCVTEDTLLVTDRGSVPIHELAPDSELVPDTFYEPGQPTQVWTGHEMVPVNRFYWNGLAATKKVTTRNGFQVEGSLAHPIRVRAPRGEKFQRLPAIRVGDYVCIDRNQTPFPSVEPLLPAPQGLSSGAKPFRYPSSLTPDLARLLGYVVAEAWTNGPYNTNISQHLDVNPESHADIRKLLLDVFGWAGNIGNADRDVLISVNSVGIRQYLGTCGITYVTSHFKEVPWCVLRGTRTSVREFLRGLFEGEASVGDGGVEFSNSSEKLVRAVQALLLRFGIVSTLSPKHIKGYDHVYWRLSFFGEDAEIFAQAIGFVSRRKNEALQARLTKARNPNKDVVPYTGKVVSRLKAALFEATTKHGANDLRKGSGLNQFGWSFVNTLKHVMCGRYNATYRFLRQLLDVAKTHGLKEHPAYLDIEEIVHRHYFYDPVVHIKTGKAHLMDIEVDHPDHCFSGNGFINHNTVESIAALCYLWEREPENKIIVIAPKSAVRQWAAEIRRFTTGVKPIVVETPKSVTQAGESLAARKAAYKEWLDAPTGPGQPKVVLIMNYALLVRDWNIESFRPLKPNGKPDPKRPVIPGVFDGTTLKAAKNLVVIFDEATAFKNMSTKTWEIARYLSDRSHRVYGLTGTLLKNHLMEGYSIYKVIKPDLFTTKTQFYADYCYVEMQSVKGNRKIPIVKGYQNLDHFRARIDPFFLGRKKYAVSNELPSLTTREVVCELSPAEETKYREALAGILELGDGSVREFEENKALVSLIYCQQVVDSLSLLRFKEGDTISTDDDVHKLGTLGSKEQELVDLITGELDDEKVIVFTRFESLVGRLQALLKRVGVQSTRITGTDKNEARIANQAAFQDLNSKTKVIFITAAGNEAINLQAAVGLVFYDLPWSWGDYVQTLGRMIRIGSPHQKVVAFHLMAEKTGTLREDVKTIDHHILAMLRKKKNLIEKVLGEGAVGALKVERGNPILELVRSMQGRPVAV